MNRHECGAVSARTGKPCRVLTSSERCPAHGGPMQVQPKRYRCTGMNKKGGVCYAKIPVEGGRCFYHPLDDVLPEFRAPGRRYPCTGTSLRGTRACRSRVAVEGGRCPYHPLELELDQVAAE